MLNLLTLTQGALSGTDIEVIDVKRSQFGLLRVTIDRENGVSIVDCERVSNQLSCFYEVEKIDYSRLEVSSPGINRPLTKESDFHRFLGHRIQIRLGKAVDGNRVFSGFLTIPKEGINRTRDHIPDVNKKAVFCLELKTRKTSLQVLDFTLDEIEHAKLDPILDFKGKKR